MPCCCGGGIWGVQIALCMLCVLSRAAQLAARPTQDERERKWRIQAVGVAPGSFDSRKALPVPWRGLRDAELRSAPV